MSGVSGQQRGTAAPPSALTDGGSARVDAASDVPSALLPDEQTGPTSDTPDPLGLGTNAGTAGRPSSPGPLTAAGTTATAGPSPLTDVADRLALRELVDTYAYAIDHRLPDLFATLFHEDGRLVLPHPAGTGRPPVVFGGRQGWERAFTAVAPFTATSHFVGNHLVRLDGDSATGSTYCLVHEIYETADGQRMQQRMAHYTDVCTRIDGRWLFLTRTLRIDWHDDRVLGPPRNPYRKPDSARTAGKEPQP